MNKMATWWFVDVLQLLEKSHPTPRGYVRPHFFAGPGETFFVTAIVRGVASDLQVDDDDFDLSPEKFVAKFSSGFAPPSPERVA